MQDESALAALTECAREKHCDLSKEHMVGAFTSALRHPNPSARVLATNGDFAWHVLDDHALGQRMTQDAVTTSPSEPAYQITLIRMLPEQGRMDEAHQAIRQLQKLNVGGRLDEELNALRMRLGDSSHG